MDHPSYIRGSQKRGTLHEVRLLLYNATNVIGGPRWSSVRFDELALCRLGVTVNFVWEHRDK